MGFYRSGMGVLQFGDFYLYAMLRRASKHGGTYKQSEAPETRPMGGLPGGAHEGSGKHKIEDEV